MIKVLHYIHGLTFGGAETIVKEYALGIDKSRFELIVLCSIRHGTEYENILERAGIRVIYIHNYTKKSPSNIIEKGILCIQRYFAVRNIIRNEKPEIIHIHLCLNSYIRFAHPKKPVKLFYHVHAEPNFVWRNNNRDKKDAKWLVRHYGMRFITLHERMCNEINQLFCVNNSVVLNNGIDFTKFSNYTNKSEKRKLIGIPEDAFVIGHIGRFEPEKNHDYLIKIFSSIVKKNRNAFLLLIGDGALKNEIIQKLGMLGLSGKYKILSNRTDIPDILHCIDFFVLPSLCEGLGIVLIESQKVGVRCIASDVVPNETCVSNLIIYKSLSDSPDFWADTILSFTVNQIEYYNIDEWNMRNVINKLQNLYLSL